MMTCHQRRAHVGRCSHASHKPACMLTSPPAAAAAAGYHAWQRFGPMSTADMAFADSGIPSFFSSPTRTGSCWLVDHQ